MTIRRIAASEEFVVWSVRPTDETGQVVDPTALPVNFAAVPLSTDLTSAVSWPDIVAAATASAAGSWAGPDESGYWQARVVVSGPTGAGQVKLPKGTYAVYVQVVDSPEQPAFVLDTLIVT